MTPGVSLSTVEVQTGWGGRCSNGCSVPAGSLGSALLFLSGLCWETPALGWLHWNNSDTFTLNITRCQKQSCWIRSFFYLFIHRENKSGFFFSLRKLKPAFEWLVVVSIWTWTNLRSLQMQVQTDLCTYRSPVSQITHIARLIPCTVTVSTIE